MNRSASNRLRALVAALLLLAPWPLVAQEPPPPTPPPTPAPTPATPPAATTTEPQQQEPGNKPQQEPKPAPKPAPKPWVPVPAPPPAGLQGKQFFWFTCYPDFLVKYDPTTDAVVQKVKLQRGLFWNVTLTHDRKRFLVVTDQQRAIEEVDVATGAVTAVHPFAEDGFVLRIRDVKELPGTNQWLVRTDRIKKEVDRYGFEPAQWLLYDVAAQKVEQKLKKLPDALDRGAFVSPDGATWHGFDDDGDLVVYEPGTYKELGKVDLHTPRMAGAGALRVTGQDLLDRRDPGRYRFLFTSDDPVRKNRTNWGVVDVDMKERRVTNVTEWGPSVSAWGLRIAHKKGIAAAMSGGFGGGSDGSDRRTRILLYDLATGQKLRETYEEFRPRRGLVAISPDADKVYIGVAGSDFEVFDAELRRLKNVELDGEISGQIFVVDG